jgi:hypothetical protein
MIWVLVLILFAPDATWAGYTYPDNAHPQHFFTEAACQEFGAAMVDGDGDNEHAVCAPLQIDSLLRPGQCLDEADPPYGSSNVNATHTCMCEAEWLGYTWVWDPKTNTNVRSGGVHYQAQICNPLMYPPSGWAIG